MNQLLQTLEEAYSRAFDQVPPRETTETFVRRHFAAHNIALSDRLADEVVLYLRDGGPPPQLAPLNKNHFRPLEP